MFTFIIGIMLGALFIYVLRGKAKAPERIERPLTADGRRLVVTEELEELVKSKKLKQMVLDDVTRAYSDYYSYEGEAFVIPKSAKVESQIKHGDWESNEYSKARDQVTEVVPNEADKGKTSNWEDWELGDSEPEVFRSSQPPPLPEQLPPPIQQPPQVRTHHAAPEVPKQPKVTKPPRPAFSQILASFMEDKHIRWGELIGGMLIVLCSAALVTSFWSTIDSIPWLKFGLFNTLTTAMFGASHFMARRWNMPSTSKGLAITATLLVPLNFLSMAAFSSHGTLELAKLLAIGVFGGLLYLSSAQIFPKGRIVLPAMVLLGALPMLFGWLASPLGVSISAFTLSAAILFGIGRLRSDGKCAVDIIPLIGIGIFAFLLATGYVAYQSGEVLGLLREVSPAIFLLSPTLLVTGIWLRSTGAESLRIQGSAAQILGVLGSVACLGLAFPSVGNLLLISLLGFGTMFAISKWKKLPEAHIPAAIFLSIFFVLLSTVLLGGMKWDTNSTETVLAALFGSEYLLSYFFSAIILMFAGHAFRSVWYKFAALWLAALHIVLMTIHWVGHVDDGGLFLFYGLYAMIAFYLAYKRDSGWAVSVGWVLSFAGLVQTLAIRFGVDSPWSWVFLILGAMGVIAHGLPVLRGHRLFEQSGFVVGSVTLSIVGLMSVWALPYAQTLCWQRAIPAALLWLALSNTSRNVWCFRAFQLSLTVGILGVVTSTMLKLDLIPLNAIFRMASVYQNPIMIQAWAGTFAIMAMLFLILRILTAQCRSVRHAHFSSFLSCDWQLDRGFILIALILPSAMVFIGMLNASLGVEVAWGELALGWGSLVNLLLVVAYLMLGLCHGWRVARVVLLFLSGIPAAVWLANALCPMLEVQDVLPVVRWAFAIYGLLVSIAVWSREKLGNCLSVRMMEGYQIRARGTSKIVEFGVYAIFAFAILLSTTVPGSPFQRLYQSMNTAIPVAISALAILGYAIRERSSWRLALSVFAAHLAVSLGAHVFSTGSPEGVVHFLQLNLVLVGLVALAWRFSMIQKLSAPWMGWYAKLGLLASLVIPLIGACILAIDPASVPDWIGAVALPWGLTSAVLCWIAGRNRGKEGLATDMALGILLATAFGVCYFSYTPWVAYRVFAGGLVAAMVPLIAWRAKSLWAVALWAAVFLLTVRGYSGDPMGHHYLVAMFTIASAGIGVLSVISNHRIFAYLATAGIVMCAELFWLQGEWYGQAWDMLCIGMIATAVAGGLGYVRYYLGLSETRQTLPPIHLVVMGVNMAIQALMTVFGVLADATGHNIDKTTGLLALALYLTIALSLPRCWMRTSARWLPAYAGGWITTLLLIGEMDFSLPRLATALSVGLGLYLLITGAIWKLRAKLLGILNAPPPEMPHMPAYFSLAHIATGLMLAGGATSYLLFSSELELWGRLLLASTILLPAAAMGIAAKGARPEMRGLSLTIAMWATIAAAWGLTDPGSAHDTILNRMAVAAAVLVSWCAIGGLVIRCRFVQDAWLGPVKNILKYAILSWQVLLPAIVLIEMLQRFSGGVVSISFAASIIVLGSLVLACVLLLLCALNLARFGRQGSGELHVYAAEGSLLLAFAHIWLTMPWLFSGVLSAYWPFIVMLLAFGGAMASEFLKRRGASVFADPVGRTVVLLPLVPVTGFWVAASAAPYSWLLFTVCIFYGAAAIIRKSFKFSLAAALAGNMALWSTWSNTDALSFMRHPQLWLIPIALTALGAAYLNRKNISKAALGNIRLVSLLVVYASSAADIFINGVGNSLWLPLILGGLSVAGVLLGIAYRVRAFLFLGASFLLLDLIAIIWHASDNLGWTWIWYAAGIVLGLSIIAMFATLEKQKPAIMKFLNSLD